MSKMASNQSAGKPPAASRHFLLRTVDGPIRITVPAEATLTFAPGIPGPRGRGVAPRRLEYAVRVYVNGKKELVGTFSGVYEFWEDKIIVDRREQLDSLGRVE